MMIVADPTRTTPNAEAIAKILADRLHLDYFDVLKKLTKKNDDVRFAYVARRIPSTLASSVMDDLKAHEYVGVDTRPDPLRTYPAGDVGANLIGYLGDDPTKVSGGLERSFNNLLAGKDGKETYEVGGGNRIPLGDNSQVKPVNGKDLKLTIDRDVQWYSQRVLRTAVQQSKARVRCGRRPRLPHRRDPGARRLPDVRPEQARQGQEAGPHQPCAERRLRAGLGGEGAHRVVAARRGQGHSAHPRSRCPARLPVLDRTIGDWFEHGTDPAHPGRRHRAQSSNIGTALAATQFTARAAVELPRQVRPRAQAPTSACPARPAACSATGDIWSTLTRAQVAFGQGLSVNALQMATAVNTIANGGELITPEPGQRSRRRPAPATRSAPRPARSAGAWSAPTRPAQTAEMMELVTTQDVGTAPGAGHRGLPGRRQDRNRAGGRRRLQLLQGRWPGRVLRRFRPGRQAAVHRLRRGEAPRRRCQRWRHRRSGVPQDPDLRPPEVRRPADRHQAARRSPSSGVATPESRLDNLGRCQSRIMGADLTRPGAPPRTPLAQVTAWTGADLRPPTSADVEVTGLSLSSQRVRPGDIYAALPGSRTHGATYAAEAVAAGAVAILTDEDGAATVGDTGTPAAGAGQPALGARPPRRAAVRRAGARPDPDGRHRHPGQDHDHPAPRGRPDGSRRTRSRDRHGRHPHRRPGREDRADHPRGARPARAVRGRWSSRA